MKPRRYAVMAGATLALALILAPPRPQAQVPVQPQGQAQLPPVPQPTTPRAAGNANPAAGGVIARGQYLTRAADCIACHTAPGGQPYAGGVPFATPFGTIYSPNITPDRATGIGAWTDAQFLRALHEGIRSDGKHLYPAFPYTSYTKLADQDVQAIRAYLNTVPPVHATPPKNDLSFPFNIRAMMTFWNLLFFKEGRQPQLAAQSAVWNRGAYLSEALGHCAECHTPRNMMMALKDQPFAGAKLQGWHAYNLTPDVNSGIGAWSEADIATYLSTGKLAGKAAAAGPMAEVIENSTQYLTPSDLQAIAVYLKALQPIAQGDSRPRTQWGAPAQDVAIWRGAKSAAGFAGAGAGAGTGAAGAQLFNANCASCHGWSGDGVAAAKADGYPALSHNSTSGATDATNLTMVILNGVHRRSANADVFMPAFRAELDDADIAAVANYVSGQFGNPQARQTAEGVAKLRAAR